jgi:hypothetical protein
MITALTPSMEVLHRHFEDFFTGPASQAATAAVRAACDGSKLSELKEAGSRDGVMIAFLQTLADVPDAKVRAWLGLHLLRERRQVPVADEPIAKIEKPSQVRRAAFLGAVAVALVLAGLLGTVLAIQMGWTNARSRSEPASKLAIAARTGIEADLNRQIRMRKRIGELLVASPVRGEALWRVLNDSGDGLLLETMLAVGDIPQGLDSGHVPFAWSRSTLWDSTAIAVHHDLPVIESAARRMGISPRLVALPAICEQLRRAESFREAYKKFFTSFVPLSNVSVGVTGIKPESLDRLLPFCDSLDRPLIDSVPVEAIRRRLQEPDHAWSYLYAALYMKCILRQWGEAGVDLSQRPEILMTIYNLGVNRCPPRPEPLAGGAVFKIDGVEYSFGSFAREFYWSGLLYPQLPF